MHKIVIPLSSLNVSGRPCQSVGALVKYSDLFSGDNMLWPGVLLNQKNQFILLKISVLNDDSGQVMEDGTPAVTSRDTIVNFRIPRYVKTSILSRYRFLKTCRNRRSIQSGRRPYVSREVTYICTLTADSNVAVII